MDVTDLALVDADGRNLLVNGTFEGGGSRWFLTADDNWSWNISNVLVELLLRTRLAGLARLRGTHRVRVGAPAGQRMPRRCDGRRKRCRAPWLPGFPPGFDSVIDDPRMRLLLWLLVTVPLMLPPRDGTTRGGRTRSVGPVPCAFVRGTVAHGMGLLETRAGAQRFRVRRLG